MSGFGFVVPSNSYNEQVESICFGNKFMYCLASDSPDQGLDDGTYTFSDSNNQIWSVFLQGLQISSVNLELGLSGNTKAGISPTDVFLAVFPNIRELQTDVEPGPSQAKRNRSSNQSVKPEYFSFTDRSSRYRKYLSWDVHATSIGLKSITIIIWPFNAAERILKTVPILERGVVEPSLSAFFNNTLQSDIDILLQDGTKMPGHTFIMRYRSPVFEVLFRPDSQFWKDGEKFLRLNMYQTELAKGLVEYIYKDSTDIDPGHVLWWLQTAGMYELTGLKRDTFNVVLKHLDSDNALDSLYQCLLHEQGEFAESVHVYIQRNNLAFAANSIAYTRISLEFPSNASRIQTT